MKRLGFRAAYLSTGKNTEARTKSLQTTEPQQFYVMCCGAFFIAVIGFILICPPIALITFIIVSNCGFAPSDKALYKLGLLNPVSSAIFVIPIDFAK
jgi:hypothetical protein